MNTYAAPDSIRRPPFADRRYLTAVSASFEYPDSSEQDPNLNDIVALAQTAQLMGDKSPKSKRREQTQKKKARKDDEANAKAKLPKSHGPAVSGTPEKP